MMTRTSKDERVQTVPEPHITSRRDHLYLGILLVSAFFRFFHIGSKPLWQDEAWSWQFTRLNWPELFHFLISNEINMSPYHLLLKLWITAFGDGETVLRSLSAIAAILTIPVVYAIGRRLFNSRVGLLAALLLSLNAFHIRYSQETRGYTLAVLLVSLAVLLCLKAIERSSLTLWIAQAFLLALATYIHMFAALVAIALWISIPIGAPHLPEFGRCGKKKNQRRLRNVIFAITLYVVLTLPLAYLAHLQGSARLGWIQPISWKAIAIFLKLFCGNSGFALAAVTVICLASALIYAVHLCRQRRFEQAWPYLLLFSWLLLPIAATTIVSVWKPVFIPRYLLICLPALSLLISAALTSWRSRLWTCIFLAALLVMSLRGIFAYYHKDFDVPRADWPALTRYIYDHAQPGDAIATRESNSAIVYYSRNVPVPGGLRIYAQEGQSERPSGQALQPFARVWCLLQNKDYGLNEFDRQQNQQLASACQQGRAATSAQSFRGLDIVFYERK